MAEQTGAAFGIYPSSGRRPERLNQSRGVNAPLQLARGWAAGLLGLPGDIEGLVRMLPGIQNETPALPTSDFYREYLPGYDERPAARAMSGLGALASGAGATSVVRGGLGAVKRATDVNAIRDYVRSAQGLSGLPGTSVVKPKGGNWISGAGSPEEAVRGLKSNRYGNPAEENIRALQGALESNPYMSLDTRAELQRQLAEQQSGAALNTWIDQKLAKYIRNEMGTPEDPLRALIQERGVSHFAEDDLMRSQAWVPDELAERRARAGFPEEGMAERLHAERGWPQGGAEDRTRMAAGWEAMSDAPLEATRAGDLLRSDVIPGTDLSRSNIADMYLRENPWLAKVPPETPVYSVENVQDMGFNHLIDELRNAVREGSDLPAELRLQPEQLSKVSMPQAVELVDRINKWRAAQKAEADLARAGNAATVEHKAYDVIPGTDRPNERGLRWVELRTPEESAALPEGYSLSTITNENLPPGHMGRNSYAVVGPQGRMLEDVGLAYTEADALGKFKRSYYGRTLEDALKYEGETMGHCVGGYCPDVVEGKSRIFSLRDAKGQPHVTVEVKPPTNQESVYLGDPRLRGNFSAEEMQLMERVYGWFTHMPEELASRVRKLIGADAPEIVQIKGKANRAPKDEYLPFVQDFVRSGQWGRVGDIQNTGMRKTREVFNFNELQMLKQLGEDHIPDALTGEDIQRLHNMIVPEGQRLKYDARGNVVGSEGANYARGGAVRAGPMTYDPDRIAALAEQLTMEA